MAGKLEDLSQKEFLAYAVLKVVRDTLKGLLEFEEKQRLVPALSVKILPSLFQFLSVFYQHGFQKVLRPITVIRLFRDCCRYNIDKACPAEFSELCNDLLDVAQTPFHSFLIYDLLNYYDLSHGNPKVVIDRLRRVSECDINLMIEAVIIPMIYEGSTSHRYFGKIIFDMLDRLQERKSEVKILQIQQLINKIDEGLTGLWMNKNLVLCDYLKALLVDEIASIKKIEAYFGVKTIGFIKYAYFLSVGKHVDKSVRFFVSAARVQCFGCEILAAYYEREADKITESDICSIRRKIELLNSACEHLRKAYRSRPCLKRAYLRTWLKHNDPAYDRENIKKLVSELKDHFQDEEKKGGLPDEEKWLVESIVEKLGVTMPQVQIFENSAGAKAKAKRTPLMKKPSARGDIIRLTSGHLTRNSRVGSDGVGREHKHQIETAGSKVVVEKSSASLRHELHPVTGADREPVQLAARWLIESDLQKSSNFIDTLKCSLFCDIDAAIEIELYKNAIDKLNVFRKKPECEHLLIQLVLIQMQIWCDVSQFTNDEFGFSQYRNNMQEKRKYHNAILRHGENIGFGFIRKLCERFNIDLTLAPLDCWKAEPSQLVTNPAIKVLAENSDFKKYFASLLSTIAHLKSEASQRGYQVNSYHKAWYSASYSIDPERGRRREGYGVPLL